MLISANSPKSPLLDYTAHYITVVTKPWKMKNVHNLDYCNKIASQLIWIISLSLFVTNSSLKAPYKMNVNGKM